MSHSDPTADRRKFGRRHTLWHAWVKVAGREREPCVVRNFSVVGALLEFAGQTPTVDRFRLIIDDYHFEALCYVRHRSANGLGVNFDNVAVGEGGFTGCTPEQLIAIMKRENSTRGH